MFDLVDVSGQLARWRLRLLEFNFLIKYRKGVHNIVADVISRLPTYGFTRQAPDFDIPCFAVENSGDSPAPWRRLSQDADPSSGTTLDWDPCDEFSCSQKSDANIIALLEDDAQILASSESRISLLTIDELRSAQLTDAYCKI